jgi:hypothetical protein
LNRRDQRREIARSNGSIDNIRGRLSAQP